MYFVTNKLKWILCSLIFILSIESQQQNVHQIIAVKSDFAYAAAKKEIFVSRDLSRMWEKIFNLDEHPNVIDEIHLQKTQTDRQMVIIACCCDDISNLWVLSTRSIAIYSQVNQTWSNISLSLDFEYISPSMFTNVGMIFWQKRIWIAGNQKLWAYHTTKKQWSSHNYPAGSSSGNLHVGLDKRLWLSGRLSFDGNTWQKLPPAPRSQEVNSAFTLDSQGRPWIIADHIYFFDFLQRKWLLAPIFHSSHLRSIACFQNEIWICDYGSGIFKLVSGKWQKINIDKPRPSLDYSYQLFSTQNTLWLNTYFGVGSLTNDKWQSHFDYTKYNSVNRLFYSTLASIIILLVICIALIFVVNRLKNNFLNRSKE